MDFCRSILEPTVRGLNMMMRAPFSGTDSGHSGWVLRTKHVRPASEKKPIMSTFDWLDAISDLPMLCQHSESSIFKSSHGFI